jgi:fumarate hydratase class I
MKMNTPEITAHLVELIKRAATDLPEPIEAALIKAKSGEDTDTPAWDALNAIEENIMLARQKVTPVCQDTGTLLFFIDYPTGWSTLVLQEQIEAAVTEATQLAYLRPNAVDSITGANSGTNLGIGQPNTHWQEWNRNYLRVRLLLKGGGCENMGTQYALPDSALQAKRDLTGVRRVLLDAVQKAQGQGCAPGVLGVCIGGDRGQGYAESKRQLLRPLDDVNEDPTLAALEERVLHDANLLGIGPMGFGGKTTLLGVKIGKLHRLPASYFVTVSYMCWAYRKRQLLWHAEGVVEYA